MKGTILAFALCVLAGCGGGGGGASNQPPSSTPSGNAPVAPALSMSAQRTKTFHFTWIPVANATTYRLFEDVDGKSGFNQVGSDFASSVTSYDYIVPLHLRLNARYFLRACNGSSCADSAVFNVVGALAESIGYFKSADVSHQTMGYFGSTVALSSDGTTLAVAARGDNSSTPGIDATPSDYSADFSGAVYIFTRTSTGQWSQQAYIKPDQIEKFESFGHALALSSDGSTLAVGAFGKALSASPTGEGDDTGAVFVFERAASTWTQRSKLTASNAQMDDRFGFAIAMSADASTLLIGASQEDGGTAAINGDSSDNSMVDSGAAYVFTKTGSTWTQGAYIKPSQPSSLQQFGSAVAMSSNGTTLMIGAPGESTNTGSVYVFTQASGQWHEAAKLAASNPAQDAYFGAALATSGDGATIAIGSWGESSAGVGVNGVQTGNASVSGAVYLFAQSNQTWTQQTYIKASNATLQYAFGYSLSLSSDGTVLAVGSPVEGGNTPGLQSGVGDYNAYPQSGAAYVFVNSQGEWHQKTYVKATNPDISDFFGAALALSGDGKTLASGAQYEQSTATGINGKMNDNSVPNAGAVYVY